MTFTCSCGHESPSELAQWARWHVNGQQWLEECPRCGQAWEVSLTTRTLARTGGRERALAE